MTDRICTPEEAIAIQGFRRKRYGALVWASVCAVALASTAVLIGNPF